MSILRRVVFTDTKGTAPGKFLDWARVTTTLGTMAEPFSVNNQHNFEDWDNFDADDEINRVDEVRGIDFDRHQLVLSGGDHHLNGGVLLPRDGR